MAEIESARVIEPAVIPSHPGRLTNQLKYLLDHVVPQLWEHPYATPFLNPVDIVSLNIPSYYDTIIHPMDLGTIKKRLESKYYWSAQQCINDFGLMFQNCYDFYPKTDRIIIMAEILEAAFGYAIGRLPKPEVNIEEVRASRRSSKRNAPEKRLHKRKAREALEESATNKRYYVIIKDRGNDEVEAKQPSDVCDANSTSGIISDIGSELAGGSDYCLTPLSADDLASEELNGTRSNHEVCSLLNCEDTEMLNVSNHQPVLTQSTEMSNMAVDCKEPEIKRVDLTLPWKLIPLSIGSKKPKIVKEYQFLPWKLIPITPN